MSGCSPKWTKPADVMKIRRLKKRNNLKPVASDLTGSRVSKVGDTGSSCCRKGSNSGKRLNPFSRPLSPNKKRKLEESQEILESSTVNGTESNKLKKLNVWSSETFDSDTEEKLENEKAEVENETEVGQSLLGIIDNIHSGTDTSKNTVSHDRKQKAKTDGNEFTEKSENVPVDWSLKQKLRIVSSCPLSWCVSLKSVEESRGLCDFVRCSKQDNEVTTEDRGSLFHSCCGYWMHPSVPWLNLFPRMVPDHKLGKSNSFTMNEDVHSAFYSDWADSFTSVFYLMRNQRCPFFYVCTHQFTVLFRAAGIGGLSTMNAVITPTTRGFRQALKDDGIEFSMPVLQHRTKRKYTEELIDTFGAELSQDINSSNEATKKNEDVEELEEEDDNLAETDEGASTWLEEMGLNKKEFPSLDPNKVKMNREGFRVIDNRPESLLLVEGTDVQAVFNFILNCKSCIASTGIQAGIPPTILAPVAYKGATQKMLKVKHSVTNQIDQHGNKTKAFVLEITGPILPHTIMRFCHLFKNLDNDDFSLVCNVHDPTQPFNFPSNKEKNSLDTEKFVCSGLSKQVLSNFIQADDDSRRPATTIRELHHRLGMYYWN